jgi:hypothetical protein
MSSWFLLAMAALNSFAASSLAYNGQYALSICYLSGAVGSIAMMWVVVK